jgi:hypothetical protein
MIIGALGLFAFDHFALKAGQFAKRNTVVINALWVVNAILELDVE